MPENIIDELEWRGLIADCTDLPALKKLTTEKKITLYCGFDPTADSLHVGNLIPLLALRRFQQLGHTPIALSGGATGLVGDPGGKASERPLLSREDLNRNLEGIKPQLERLLYFNPNTNSPLLNPAILVDNAEWTAEMKVLDFLRDVGKHITINNMLSKEWVRSRLKIKTDSELPIHSMQFIDSNLSESSSPGSGLSYTEFSYMLIQANDFYHLNKIHGCELQVAGTDQWGNITAGTELTRKKTGKSVHGLTFPLLTNADGTKFGKSVAGAIWLNPIKDIPEVKGDVAGNERRKNGLTKFYQFWLQTDDRDVIKLLKFFTFLKRGEIDDLENKLKTKPEQRAAQKALADEMTVLIHGKDSLQEVRPSEGAENIFTIESEDLRRLPPDELEKTVIGINVFVWPDDISKGYPPLVDVLVKGGLVKSKSEARTAILQGGIYINKTRVPIERAIKSEDLLKGSILILSRGKRNYLSVQFKSHS